MKIATSEMGGISKSVRFRHVLTHVPQSDKSTSRCGHVCVCHTMLLTVRSHTSDAFVVPPPKHGALPVTSYISALSRCSTSVIYGIVTNHANLDRRLSHRSTRLSTFICELLGTSTAVSTAVQISTLSPMFFVSLVAQRHSTTCAVASSAPPTIGSSVNELRSATMMMTCGACSVSAR